jgi:hypothetical protein
MQVFQDFYMDFFFVEDSLPLISRWLKGADTPKEINLVYKEKYLLSEICKKINELGSHSVEVEFTNDKPGRNYCGDGTILQSQNLNLKGLEYGIKEIFKNMN